MHTSGLRGHLDLPAARPESLSREQRGRTLARNACRISRMIPKSTIPLTFDLFLLHLKYGSSRDLCDLFTFLRRGQGEQTLSHDLTWQVVVVTGGGSGLGKGEPCRMFRYVGRTHYMQPSLAALRSMELKSTLWAGELSCWRRSQRRSMPRGRER